MSNHEELGLYTYTCISKALLANPIEPVQCSLYPPIRKATPQITVMVCHTQEKNRVQPDLNWLIWIALGVLLLTELGILQRSFSSIELGEWVR